MHTLEQKLDDAKFNQVKLEDKLRDKDRELIHLTDRLNKNNYNQGQIVFNSQDGFDN